MTANEVAHVIPADDWKFVACDCGSNFRHGKLYNGDAKLPVNVVTVGGGKHLIELINKAQILGKIDEKTKVRLIAEMRSYLLPEILETDEEDCEYHQYIQREFLEFGVNLILAVSSLREVVH